MKGYPVNEIFYSIQGEGVRAGTANVFVRFAGCNQTCSMESHGFDCDTEFVSNVMMTAEEIEARIVELWPNNTRSVEHGPNVILTGGEPLLHLDQALIDRLRGFFIAVETNGSLECKWMVDWLCVSPKVAEHAIRQKTADEVKYVRNAGQGCPMPACKATHMLLSPAHNADGLPEPGALQTCIDIVKKAPGWRLSVQQHKLWKVR